MQKTTDLPSIFGFDTLYRVSINRYTQKYRKYRIPDKTSNIEISIRVSTSLPFSYSALYLT